MFHRIREAMREGDLGEQLGGSGRVVEVDETFIGNKGKQHWWSEAYYSTN